MRTASSEENRTINSFAASFSVAMTLLTGFLVVATAIALTSAALAVTGFIIMLGGLGLYGLMLV